MKGIGDLKAFVTLSKNEGEKKNRKGSAIRQKDFTGSVVDKGIMLNLKGRVGEHIRAAWEEGRFEKPFSSCGGKGDH